MVKSTLSIREVKCFKRTHIASISYNISIRGHRKESGWTTPDGSGAYYGLYSHQVDLLWWKYYGHQTDLVRR